MKRRRGKRKRREFEPDLYPHAFITSASVNGYPVTARNVPDVQSLNLLRTCAVYIDNVAEDAAENYAQPGNLC